MQKVIVTGGGGFIGREVVQQLQALNIECFVPRSSEFDLRDKDAVSRFYRLARHSDAVIHLAARVDGILANRASPATFYYDNLMMGIHIQEQARYWGIPKCVTIGTVCAYPKFTPIPFKEVDLWNGYPEETNAAYGLAKRALLVHGQALRQQHGYNVIHLLLANTYGAADSSHHVIPDMLRKFQSGASEVILYGNGSATRDFLHVKDAARGIIQALFHYNEPEPVNIGTGIETSIRDLANLLADSCGYPGTIIWDDNKPNGQPRRVLDTSRSWEQFGFVAEIPLRLGVLGLVKPVHA